MWLISCWLHVEGHLMARTGLSGLFLVWRSLRWLSVEQRTVREYSRKIQKLFEGGLSSYEGQLRSMGFKQRTSTTLMRQATKILRIIASYERSLPFVCLRIHRIYFSHLMGCVSRH